MKVTFISLALLTAVSAQSCTDTSASCNGPIINRCLNGTRVNTNCNDVLSNNGENAVCNSYAPGYATCTIPTTNTTSTTKVLQPGATCTGTVSNCDGPIILRCMNGTVASTNCNDVLDAANENAVCSVQNPTVATCVISSTTTTSISSVPTAGSACSGVSSYCNGDIILECMNGTLAPHNCNDILDASSENAVCTAYAPSKASCTLAATLSTGSGSFPTGSITSAPVPTSTTGSSAPIVTGGAVAAPGIGAAVAAVGGLVGIVAVLL